jgi:uncharacterized membrane protein (DUF373 family)
MGKIIRHNANRKPKLIFGGVFNALIVIEIYHNVYALIKIVKNIIFWNDIASSSSAPLVSP